MHHRVFIPIPRSVSIGNRGLDPHRLSSLRVSLQHVHELEKFFCRGHERDLAKDPHSRNAFFAAQTIEGFVKNRAHSIRAPIADIFETDAEHSFIDDKIDDDFRSSYRFCFVYHDASISFRRILTERVLNRQHDRDQFTWLDLREFQGYAANS